MDIDSRSRRGLVTGAALLAAGVASGAVLAGTLNAGAAATPTPAPSTTAPTTTPATTAPSSGPGVQENDGIPESQEHHGHGGGLSLSGTVTAVGSASVTIRQTGGTTTYAVSSTSDIDKNGEAQLSSLAVGDAVTYSVTAGTTTIDKLHAGDETKDRPTA